MGWGSSEDLPAGQKNAKKTKERGKNELALRTPQHGPASLYDSETLMWGLFFFLHLYIHTIASRSQTLFSPAAFVFDVPFSTHQSFDDRQREERLAHATTFYVLMIFGLFGKFPAGYIADIPKILPCRATLM